VSWRALADISRPPVQIRETGLFFFMHGSHAAACRK
jgi:hypothetical protein